MTSTRTRLAITELTTTLTTDFDLAALLEAVATEAQVCFGAYAAAVILHHHHGDGTDADTGLHIVAQALRDDLGSDGAEGVDLSFQATGPASDSARDGAVTMIADLSDTSQSTGTRWARYRRHAAAAGMRGMRAFPITSLGIPLGAVVVHTDDPWGVQRPNDFGQILANLTGVALSIGPRERRRGGTADTIEVVLRDTTLIATATGIIAEVLDLDVRDARLRLRRLAREHGVTLTAHARAIVETHDDQPPASATAAVLRPPPDLLPPRHIDT